MINFAIALSVIITGWFTQFINPTNVVLITIDGVRWQEVFNGTDSTKFHGQQLSPKEIVPNLYTFFVNDGIAFGKESNIVASGPTYISLPGYLEIMRGHATKDCYSNNCKIEATNTINDAVFEHEQTSKIGIFSSWDVIRKVPGSHRDKFSVNVGKFYRSKYWQTLGESDNKKYVNPFFEDGSYRPDTYTTTVALDYLKTYHPRFLWVSLGDTDEWAHRGQYNNYIMALKAADVFIGKIIANTNKSNTVIIVTTDHGRGTDWRSHYNDINSRRVWLMMYGNSVPKLGFIKTKNELSLSNIYPTVLDIMYEMHSDQSLLHQE